MNKLDEHWRSKPPQSQFKIIRITCIYRGLAGKSEFSADSISRRLGILAKKPVKVDLSIDSSITGSSERTNSKYDLLCPNKLLKEME